MIKKIILGIIGIVLLVAAGVAARYLLAYNGFLDKITERKPEMKNYSVVVSSKSEIEDVAALANKGVGFLKADTKAANAAQKLDEIVKTDVAFYDEANLMIESLNSRVIDAIVLESDRYELLKEEIKDLADTTKVIYQFEIELNDEEVAISDKEITTEPFIVYISGSDSRTGLQTTASSDVNIVVAVNPQTGKILLASIPRDTYVQLHDTVGLKDKLTHAGIYGINMSKTTIEDFLGIKIDYTVKVSFDTVIKVVDQLDGIDIESDAAMTLNAFNGKKCTFVEGKQHVDGDCALRFARERKTYLTGDRHRGENQQQVITSIIGRLSGSKDYLLKIPTILDIAADSFETTISRDNISKFIRRQLTDPINWQVKSIAVDGIGTHQPTYSMGSNLPLYVMIPDPESVQKVKEEINAYLVANDKTEDDSKNAE